MCPGTQMSRLLGRIRGLGFVGGWNFQGLSRRASVLSEFLKAQAWGVSEFRVVQFRVGGSGESAFQASARSVRHLCFSDGKPAFWNDSWTSAACQLTIGPRVVPIRLAELAEVHDDRGHGRWWRPRLRGWRKCKPAVCWHEV